MIVPPVQAPLPTLADIKEAQEGLWDAVSRVDSFAVRVHESGLDAESDSIPACQPSFELIGGLYSFAADLEMLSGELKKDADEIQEAAREAYMVREEPMYQSRDV